MHEQSCEVSVRSSHILPPFSIVFPKYLLFALSLSLSDIPIVVLPLVPSRRFSSRFRESPIPHRAFKLSESDVNRHLSISLSTLLVETFLILCSFLPSFPFYLPLPLSLALAPCVIYHCPMFVVCSPKSSTIPNVILYRLYGLCIWSRVSVQCQCVMVVDFFLLCKCVSFVSDQFRGCLPRL